MDAPVIHVAWVNSKGNKQAEDFNALVTRKVTVRQECLIAVIGNDHDRLINTHNKYHTSISPATNLLQLLTACFSRGCR
jgi:hypothetical protein